MLQYRTFKVNWQMTDTADFEMIWVLGEENFPVCEALEREAT